MTRSRPWSPGRRRRLARLVLAVTTPLTLLATLEAGARLLLEEPGNSPLWEPSENSGPGSIEWVRSEIHQRDPYLIWRNRPDLDLRYKGAHVHTNSFGLRGPAISKAKPPGVYRILSLGESTSFGSKVADRETYTAVLERCLRRRNPGWKVEVLNAGCVGWTLAQSYEYLRHEGLAFEPDAVLLYHGFNDFLRASYAAVRTTRQTNGTDLDILERDRSWADDLDAWLRTNSRAWRCAMHALSGADAPPRSVPSGLVPRQEKPLFRVPEEDRRELLGRLRTMSEEEGFELIVVIPAYRSEERHRQVLLEFVQAAHVPFVDLEEVVALFPVPRARLFEDPSHPTADLHLAYGQRLCEFFEEHLSLPGPSPTAGEDADPSGHTVNRRER